MLYSIIFLAITIFLSVCSTAIMMYVALATGIGPWIAPTLVLATSILLQVIRPRLYEKSLGLITSGSSVGGIMATAVAFALPTLYFLDAPHFAQIVATPFTFSVLVFAVSLTAGWFGLWIANVIEYSLLVEQKLKFPIGVMIHGMIATHHNMQKAYEMILGFCASLVFACLQNVISLLPKKIILNAPLIVSYVHIPAIIFDVSPLLWAIGFVTGHVIAIPLAIGALSRILIAGPIHTMFFGKLGLTEFNFAFCSGMVLCGTTLSFLTSLKKWKYGKKDGKTQSVAETFFKQDGMVFVELLLFLCVAIGFLSWMKFSLLTQLYLLVLTFVFTRQVALIAGRIGLAPLGTFATFVMVPALFLFKLSTLQIVIIATFVEICCGVCADILFGRKVAQLGSIEKTQVKLFQYVGLVASSLCVGAILWLLITKFQLGSPELCAYKAHSRALLIQALNVINYNALIPGILFALLLYWSGINSALVLGGLLMPLSISLGLIIGGCLTYCVKQKEDWFPLWSGIFAAQSVWMLITALS